ncbi:hypothetical protein [Embleya sp. NBC_00896]|uniref:hypothetical protein n=1 Tax=Embleya sp. NBC_00896 TaxID=2975961 RepID=UPI002F918617|nr:hypothetical protein OG928_41230 [Embleya sp. NBC_00896]
MRSDTNWRFAEHTDAVWGRVAAMLAGNPGTPDVLLWRLAESRDGLALLFLGKRPDLPERLMRRLLGHADREVREALLDNPSWGVEVRVALHTDPDPTLRSECVAVRHGTIEVPPELPRAVYVRLAADPDPAVRATLAGVESLPDDLTTELAGDRDRRVRMGLLYRWGTLPEAARARLLADGDDDMRRDLALHVPGHRPSAEVRRALLADPRSAPRFVAVTPLDPDEVEEFATHADPRIRAAVAANPTLPVGRRAALAEDAEDRVRMAVATRPDVRPEESAAIRPWAPEALFMVDWLLDRLDDVDLLVRYLDSPHPAFRRGIAHSPALPADAVARLAVDEDFHVRRILATHHPDAPTGALVGRVPPLRKGPSGPQVHHRRFPQEVLRRFAGSRVRYLRSLAAMSRQSPPALVELLSHDPEPVVRACAAATSRLPDARVLELLADPDPEVVARLAGRAALPVAAMEFIVAKAGL